MACEISYLGIENDLQTEHEQSPCLFNLEKLHLCPSDESDEEFVTLSRYIELKCQNSEWLEMDKSVSSSINSLTEKSRHNDNIKPKFLRQKTIRIRQSTSAIQHHPINDDRIHRLVEHLRQTVSCHNFLEIHKPVIDRKEQTCDLLNKRRNAQVSMLNSYVGQMDLVDILNIKSWITPSNHRHIDDYISKQKNSQFENYQSKRTKKTSIGCGLFECLNHHRRT